MTMQNSPQSIKSVKYLFVLLKKVYQNGFIQIITFKNDYFQEQ